MELTLQAIIVGIAIGFLYGLVGLSYTVIYNSTKVINFALGDFVMLGGLLTAFGVSNLQLWLVPTLLIIAVLLTLFSVVIYKYLIAPLLKNSVQIALLSTLALSALVADVAGIITKNKPISVNPYIEMGTISLGPAKVQPQYLLLIGSVLLFIIAYWYFLYKTRWGIAMRATGMDSEAAKITGIRTGTMIALSFALAGFVAAFGGSMYAPVSTPIATAGLALGINGFVAATVGGFDHPFGAVVGGLVVGVIQQLLTAFTNSVVAEISTFAILIIILVVRPQGIFAEKQ